MVGPRLKWKKMQNFTLVLGCNVVALFFIRFLILSLIDILSGLLATDWLGDCISSALAPSIETVLTGDPVSMKNLMLEILFVAFKFTNFYGYKSLILLKEKETIPTKSDIESSGSNLFEVPLVRTE